MIKNIDYDDYWKIWSELNINSIFNKLKAKSEIQDVNPESLEKYYYTSEVQVPN
jgi:hypothetical protein